MDDKIRKRGFFSLRIRISNLNIVLLRDFLEDGPSGTTLEMADLND